MNIKRFRFVLSFVFSIALVLNACGGSQPEPTTNITMNMTDFSFNPAVVAVPAGKEISIALNNSGAVEHQFVIMKQGAEVTSPFDADDKENIYWEVVLQIGESQNLTFVAPSEPGEYQIACGTAGHHEAGMIGKLIVVKEASQ